MSEGAPKRAAVLGSERDDQPQVDVDCVRRPGAAAEGSVAEDVEVGGHLAAYLLGKHCEVSSDQLFEGVGCVVEQDVEIVEHVDEMDCGDIDVPGQCVHRAPWWL
ncbi:hypothetical protein [Streptomyces capitiformicae]|uniref:Uncharacterized protein n=1 Tax=Streptomyces capitiformicae TaxID=2014920 RepID=A0A918Z1Z4_9ACTN|nr:hypothetical protein [Streptomyces capitiformicae]GHE33122.1 hypothetical protein GCM10017771_50130 [Streptomyces capitiformicae]